MRPYSTIFVYLCSIMQNFVELCQLDRSGRLRRVRDWNRAVPRTRPGCAPTAPQPPGRMLLGKRLPDIVFDNLFYHNLLCLKSVFSVILKISCICLAELV